MSQAQYDYSLFGAEHIRRYRETAGEVGHIWNGAPCLILTTTRAKAGTPRESALIYGRDGDDYLVVASKGGAPEHPLWYRDLVANPDVQIEVLAERMVGRSRTATPEEKVRLWPIMTGHWPPYDDYAKKTTRDIPVVIIHPTR